MPKTESRTMIFVGFALTLGAGIAGGILLTSRLGGGTPVSASEARSPLESALDLTQDQSKQMRGIWINVRGNIQNCLTRAQSLERQRQRDMESLLTDDQKAKFQKISEDYNAKVLDLKAERTATFDKAVTQTEQILNEQQRQKYVKMLRERTGVEPGQGLLDVPASLSAATPGSSDFFAADAVFPKP